MKLVIMKRVEIDVTMDTDSDGEINIRINGKLFGYFCKGDEDGGCFIMTPTAYRAVEARSEGVFGLKAFEEKED